MSLDKVVAEYAIGEMGEKVVSKVAGKAAGAVSSMFFSPDSLGGAGDVAPLSLEERRAMGLPVPSSGEVRARELAAAEERRVREFAESLSPEEKRNIALAVVLRRHGR